MLQSSARIRRIGYLASQRIVRYLFQPLGSKQCGQTCVAMLLGIPLNDVINEIGKEGVTTTKDLVTILHTHGFETSGRRERIGKSTKLPDTCILSMKIEGQSNWHWVLYVNGKYLDPDEGPLSRYPQNNNAFRFTSYIEIKPTNEQREKIVKRFKRRNWILFIGALFR